MKYRLWRAEPAGLCSLAVNIVCRQIWTSLIWNAAFFCPLFLFHTVAKPAGVRITDQPNTETPVFVLPESARSGAKFVYTKIWALSGTLCSSSSAAVKSGGKARNLNETTQICLSVYWRRNKEQVLTHTHTSNIHILLIPSEWNLTHQRQLIMKRPADSRS